MAKQLDLASILRPIWPATAVSCRPMPVAATAGAKAPETPVATVILRATATKPSDSLQHLIWRGSLCGARILRIC